MKEYVSIESVWAREILDSRGNPTVEVEVLTEGGYSGRASVPSGASVGAYEAVELRDGTKSRYMGMGVQDAVTNVNEIIAPEIEGMNVFDQISVDRLMILLDGTANKSKLGANAILGVSIAVAKAAAEAAGFSLYNYIGGVNATTLPVPMMNVLNGGRHADNSVNIQEFMIVPAGAPSFSDALRWGVEITRSLKQLLKSNNMNTAVGDEGGCAPNLQSDEDAIELLVQAIEGAGFIPGKDIYIAIDAAASEMSEAAKQAGRPDDYYFWKSDVWYTKEQLIDYWERLVDKYPIISLEDGIGEDDAEAWKLLTQRLGNRVMIVGDDLFVTNAKRLQQGIDDSVANAIIIKPNQIGTLSETMETISLAHRNGYSAIISHRSGETEDATIADISVAVNSGWIKTGAPIRTDRVAKYNQLLRIEEELGDIAVYPEKKMWYNSKSNE